jgi:hypothetical protein
MKVVSKRTGIGLGTTVAALFAVLFAIGAHSASGSGSCVDARTPARSGGTLYGKATHTCSGSKKMYAFIQARHGRLSHVYTLASGSTTGSFVKIGARKCPFSGTWHTWTLATRGLKTDTSGVLTYSCTT